MSIDGMKSEFDLPQYECAVPKTQSIGAVAKDRQRAGCFHEKFQCFSWQFSKPKLGKTEFSKITSREIYDKFGFSAVDGNLTKANWQFNKSMLMIFKPTLEKLNWIPKIH